MSYLTPAERASNKSELEKFNQWLAVQPKLPPRTKMETTEMHGGVVLTHHNRKVCQNPPCPLHSPSDHPLKNAPLMWDRDSNLMKRWDESQDKYVIDPDDITYRKAQAEGRTLIFRNASKCLKCNTTIESTHRHDFVSCQCGDIFVDGGFDYLRGGWKDDAYYVDLSEVIE